MKKSKLWGRGIGLAGLMLALLACGVGQLLPERPTLPPPPSLEQSPLPTPSPAVTRAEPVSTTPPRGPLPTFTPRFRGTTAPLATGLPAGSQPTIDPEVTPTAAEGTTPAGDGPLTFTYTISWQIDPTNSGLAVATVEILAAGGSDYTFFRDELPVDGPVFSYRWAVCSGNPGSLRVTAGDGQSLKIDYYESPPCP